MRLHMLFWASLIYAMGWGCAPAPSAALPSTVVATPQTLLHQNELDSTEAWIFLRAYKREQELEVWARANDDHFQLLLTYPFCTTSGSLGPKRQEGDLQIPEGCYHIDRFNPNSRFYLSLGLNYPNSSDRIRGHPQEPGSNIFIHGGCASVGCIPITDGGIYQLYHLASFAKESGQARIPVYIFPTRDWASLWKSGTPHQAFWRELHPIDLYFERTHQLPIIRIQADGRYQVVK